MHIRIKLKKLNFKFTNLRTYLIILIKKETNCNNYNICRATVVHSFGEYYSGLVSVLPHQLNIREQELIHKPA